ncbi:hypothetical protein Rhopal_006651-T1 [Rhodotorula paludigena]|uniref:Uncharacterized protein n=1 Tax=Rhodotorula paludigena TaxID=86838 RepID=A0AAV5GSX2_9BASI|nr:hypothetical protein Rhopal_006651-T1 [Rhodotorula paludigena]
MKAVTSLLLLAVLASPDANSSLADGVGLMPQHIHPVTEPRGSELGERGSSSGPEVQAAFAAVTAESVEAEEDEAFDDFLEGVLSRPNDHDDVVQAGPPLGKLPPPPPPSPGPPPHEGPHHAPPPPPRGKPGAPALPPHHGDAPPPPPGHGEFPRPPHRDGGSPPPPPGHHGDFPPPPPGGRQGHPAPPRGPPPRGDPPRGPPPRGPPPRGPPPPGHPHRGPPHEGNDVPPPPPPPPGRHHPHQGLDGDDEEDAWVFFRSRKMLRRPASDRDIDFHHSDDLFVEPSRRGRKHRHQPDQYEADGAGVHGTGPHEHGHQGHRGHLDAPHSVSHAFRHFRHSAAFLARSIGHTTAFFVAWSVLKALLAVAVVVKVVKVWRAKKTGRVRLEDDAEAERLPQHVVAPEKA